MGLTKAAALAYLMFNLYTPPCFAALGSMNSEMKSGKWLFGGICLQLATGYTVAFALIILWRIRKSDKEFASEYRLHSVRS